MVTPFSIFKSQEKKDKKDFEDRVNQFMEEYSKVVRKYRVDFDAYLAISESSTSINARLRMIDITKRLEEEEKKKSPIIKPGVVIPENLKKLPPGN